MSKLIKLVLNNATSEIKAEDISGFSTGLKQGNGYVYILGVATPITQDFEISRNQWLEYINNQVLISAQVFEFKDMDNNSITARLSDVITVRQEGNHSLVVMTGHVRIQSRDDYWTLKEQFIKALKA